MTATPSFWRAAPLMTPAALQSRVTFVRQGTESAVVPGQCTVTVRRPSEHRWLARLMAPAICWSALNAAGYCGCCTQDCNAVAGPDTEDGLCKGSAPALPFSPDEVPQMRFAGRASLVEHLECVLSAADLSRQHSGRRRRRQSPPSRTAPPPSPPRPCRV